MKVVLSVVFKLGDVQPSALQRYRIQGEGEELLTKIPFTEFMSRTLKLRGSNTATVKDLVDLRKWMHKELHQLRRLQTRMSQLVLPQGLNGLPFEYVLHV